jgi:hypothetical protein
MSVFTIYLHIEMGRRTEAQNGCFLDLEIFNCFHFFLLFQVRVDYSLVDVRVIGVCSIFSGSGFRLDLISRLRYGLYREGKILCPCIPIRFSLLGVWPDKCT